MQSSISAVILCAGKGTRMNDDTKSKVCFECGGVPVIRRILRNMRLGGVSRFVLVVGHRAESVMECLGDEPGVVYAYQKEQRGTGDAARCGLQVLQDLGVDGRVLIVMGDKVVAPTVIAGMIEKALEAEAVWGVQPVAVNPGGGRVMVRDGRPYGVVEWADVAYQSLAGVLASERWGVLRGMHLNEKKSRKVLEKVERIAPAGVVTLCGERFYASELREAEYANAALYCFDLEAALEGLRNCRADNAQGEIYLTDLLEFFAGRNGAKLQVIESGEDMLTFSTKSELRTMGRHFLLKASECLRRLEAGEWDGKLLELYGASGLCVARERYRGVLALFLKQYGDKGVLLTRAPGRVNLMGRHIDHRGGMVNMMTISQDVVMAVAPRDDDRMMACNVDESFPSAEFSVGETLALGGEYAGDWLRYLEAPAVKAALAVSRGHWLNYVKSAVLRCQVAQDFPLCGMEMAVSGNIPTGAGLSSSSALVVATMEAVSGLNCLNLSRQSFIELCGEGEWFVGSRGGAGDHAAMKCGRRGVIIPMGFKPFQVLESAPFSEKYAVLVANSCQQAKKSEGSKDVFNARVATYELAFLMLRELHPERGWRVFRELAEIEPVSSMYRLLKELPVEITRAEVSRRFPRQREFLERLFATHTDPGTYELRAVTLYGLSECVRAKRLSELLCAADYRGIGEMMKISQDGDRFNGTCDVSDEALENLAQQEAPLWHQCGAYRCSTERIDGLCDLLDGTPGVLGSALVGAGLGGSVVALIQEETAENILSVLNTQFYDRLGLPHAAQVYRPGDGAGVIFQF